MFYNYFINCLAGVVLEKSQVYWKTYFKYTYMYKNKFMLDSY